MCSHRLRERTPHVCKRIGQKSDESRYFFPLILSFSREKKSARNALKRANERVDFYLHTSRHLREEFLSSSVAFYLCSSFERARKRSLLLHVGYIEESIQVLSALVPHHETTRAELFTYTNDTTQ
jgi:hypothetical protein